MTTPGPGTIWAAGDSITAGGHLPRGALDSWAGQLDTRIGGEGAGVIINHGVGGIQLHDPAGGPTLETALRAALAAGPPPRIVITMCGTNDLVNHDLATLEQSRQAMIAIDVLLQYVGIQKRLWCTILPRGLASARTNPDQPPAQPDAWLPNLVERWRAWNAWMVSMWGPKGQLIDLTGVLEEDAASGLVTKPYLIDGLHPNAWGGRLITYASSMPRFWL